MDIYDIIFALITLRGEDYAQIPGSRTPVMKRVLCKILIESYVDALFRRMNRDKLLVIMYHGVCRQDYNPPVWTQLPKRIFLDHIRFLKGNYNLISMNDVIACFQHNKPFPKSSALLTFDDGLRNNYTVVFPILKEYDVPATIFLTVNYISTEKTLWFDELYFLITKGLKQRIPFESIDDIFTRINFRQRAWSVYSLTIEKMKRLHKHDRDRIMNTLRARIKIDLTAIAKDFGMLTWDQVLEMKDSGFVDFGVHTSNHRILSELREEDWEKEIHEPRIRLSKILGDEVLTFCYPNGRPDIDFNVTHEIFLKKCGYGYAFTTESVLNDVNINPYRIGRIPAGNDFTSDRMYFRLNTSGAINAMKRVLTLTNLERLPQRRVKNNSDIHV